MEALTEGDLDLASGLLIMFPCDPINKTNMGRVISLASNCTDAIVEDLAESNYWRIRAIESIIMGDTTAVTLIYITYARYLRNKK